MHRVSRYLLLAAVAAGALGFAAAAHAGGPTPTPTPTPSPTATPTPSPTATPVPTSTITIRFVRNGEPVAVYPLQLDVIFADEVACVGGRLDADSRGVGVFSISWPLDSGELECTKGPPTTLRFEFLAGEGQSIDAEFLWTGGDITVDVEVPPLATPTPTATVEELPATGGPPSQEPLPLPVEEVLIVATFLMSAAVFLALQSRK